MSCSIRTCPSRHSTRRTRSPWVVLGGRKSVTRAVPVGELQVVSNTNVCGRYRRSVTSPPATDNFHRPSSASPRIAENTAWESNRRSEEHTAELQSRGHLVCRLLLENNKAEIQK